MWRDEGTFAGVPQDWPSTSGDLSPHLGGDLSVGSPSVEPPAEICIAKTQVHHLVNWTEILKMYGRNAM